MILVGNSTAYALVMIAGVYSNQVPTTIDTTLRLETMESCSNAKKELEQGIAKPLGGNGQGANILIQLYCIGGTLVK